MDVQLEEIKRCIEHAGIKNEEISHWSVGEQVEHILLSEKGILERLLQNFKSLPEEGKPINFFGYLMLWTGYIPRGKGESPVSLIPEGLSKDALLDLHKEVCGLYLEAQQKKPLLDQSHFAFPHPYFGMLTVKQWFRFLEVHTNHHLKIIRELLRSSPKNS